MVFFLITFFGMWAGRRLGWAISKDFLYSVNASLAVAVCITWGGFVALLIHALIVWQHPHWLLKYVMGFALGAYVAIPNYGLVAESTVRA